MDSLPATFNLWLFGPPDAVGNRAFRSFRLSTKSPCPDLNKTRSGVASAIGVALLSAASSGTTNWNISRPADAALAANSFARANTIAAEADSDACRLDRICTIVILPAHSARTSHPFEIVVFLLRNPNNNSADMQSFATKTSLFGAIGIATGVALFLLFSLHPASAQTSNTFHAACSDGYASCGDYTTYTTSTYTNVSTGSGNISMPALDYTTYSIVGHYSYSAAFSSMPDTNDLSGVEANVYGNAFGDSFGGSTRLSGNVFISANTGCDEGLTYSYSSNTPPSSGSWNVDFPQCIPNAIGNSVAQGVFNGSFSITRCLKSAPNGVSYVATGDGMCTASPPTCTISSFTSSTTTVPATLAWIVSGTVNASTLSITQTGAGFLPTSGTLPTTGHADNVPAGVYMLNAPGSAAALRPVP